MKHLIKRLQAALYHLRCQIWPHNVLKIHELPKTWCDRDEIMFHAVFQILVDFIELEQPLIDWDDKKKGRFTDVDKMTKYVERWYGPNSVREDYYFDLPDEEKIQADARLQFDYEMNSELLYLYKWYKDKKYEFDFMRYYEMIGEDLEAGKGPVENGKPKLITWSEFHQIEKSHDLACDIMLRRVLTIRRYLWT